MSAGDEVRKIYPNISELTSIHNNIKCSENSCNKYFSSQSNLSMHLQRHHHRKNIVPSPNLIQQFHCPDPTCVYNKEQYFKKIKYLKQHYLKVHATKCYKCDKCKQKFSTESYLKEHFVYCGISFNCNECNNYYKSYEALTTHGRRKKHKIPAKVTFVKRDTNSFVSEKQETVSASKQKTVSKCSLIAPKDMTVLLPVLVQVVGNNDRADKSIQTDGDSKVRPGTRRRATQTNISEKKRNRSFGTQTRSRKKPQKNKPKLLDYKNVLSFIDDTDKTFDLNLFDSNSFNNCNSQTQTDVIFDDKFLQSNVFTSHIETQTNVDQELDLYSNMYTQTCGDLLSDLEFSNIQTQTNLSDYDMFVSTETQTYNMLGGRGICHMETQTDMEFKQLLLEEINA